RRPGRGVGGGRLYGGRYGGRPGRTVRGGASAAEGMPKRTLGLAPRGWGWLPSPVGLGRSSGAGRPATGPLGWGGPTGGSRKPNRPAPTAMTRHPASSRQPPPSPTSRATGRRLAAGGMAGPPGGVAGAGPVGIARSEEAGKGTG